MAMAELDKIDSKLAKIYENAITTNTSNNTEDRSALLLDQMSMIAFNNKIVMKLK